MSGGRVTLEVGVGAMTEEFEALGVPSAAWRATNECITIMKELWTNPDPTYHSSRRHFADLKFSPNPCKILIPCGSWLQSGRCAVRRRWAMAGTLGMSPEEFSAAQEVRKSAAVAGRDPDA